ncbi:hypothetical protein Afil01_55370 [Actinorhabdospora filicis]|uniref:Addiction module toxin RelE n=1 Tax=Actinorhabdospora filicis TaxID=1785913 RepID=A0A9W6SRP4_9ACTN|nr:type II toxin-antitoxin system RelE/ParE family toxin [Actinorhabdospora filicis]GLZ80730.1 hypothetical protein Afil01_55370 [Actinorhabdospora filicis]
MEEWEIYATDEFRAWWSGLDEKSQEQVVCALDVLAETGPRLGRPLVDVIHGSRLHNLKELRPGSSGRSELRILFAFDPWRAAVILLGGDKAGEWSTWYRTAIPEAEARYETYLSDRIAEGL